MSGRTDTELLIRAYRGRGRLGYAVTPRFAVTSTDAQLAMAGELLAAHPGRPAPHPHVGEPRRDRQGRRAVPLGARDYLDVYDRFGLVGPRSVFAHCVHCDEDAMAPDGQGRRLRRLLPLIEPAAGQRPVRPEASLRLRPHAALGTDIGGGGSFSQLQMMAEAYKVGPLQGDNLDPLQAFYLGTLAGARALHIDGRVGNLAPGKEADFVVLGPRRHTAAGPAAPPDPHPGRDPVRARGAGGRPPRWSAPT